MTSRASKRLDPALGLFVSSFKKNTGVIILLAAAMLIFCPGLFLSTLGYRTFEATPTDAHVPEYLSVLFGFAGITSCMFVTIGNYISFSYLYKKNSSDVFHALPLTRAKLLISRAAASFVTVSIPLTLGYLALLFLTAFYPTYVLGTFSQIASAYIMNLICMLMVSAYSLVFIVCAGSTFDLIISYGGFNIGVLVFGGIIASVASTNLSGYSMDGIADLLKVLSPLAYCSIGAAQFAEGGADYGGYSLTKNIGYIICMLVLTAAFSAAAVLLYNRRKAERGGQAYAYKFIYIVCSVIAGICGGYILSRIFVLASDSRQISIIGILSFAAGALLACVVYGAVTERGFKKFTNSLIYGAVSLAIYLVVFAVIANGAFGFSSRIPKKEDVASVRMNYRGYCIDLDNIEPVLALHKAIIDKDANDFIDDTVETPHDYISIMYSLKDGGTFHREYYADLDKVNAEMLSCICADERFEDCKNVIDKSRSTYFTIAGYDENESFEYNATKAQCKQLIDVYKTELKKYGMAVANNEATASLDIYDNKASDNLDYYSGDCIFGLELNGDFSETLALLNTFERVDTE